MVNQEAPQARASCCADHVHTERHGGVSRPRDDRARPTTAIFDNLPEGSEVSRLYIEQMDCPTEEALIRKKLGSMRQVHALDFNLMRRVLTVAHANGAGSSVQAAIGELGMNASTEPRDFADRARDHAHHSHGHGEGGAHHHHGAHTTIAWWPLVVAGLMALAAEVVHWMGGAQWAQAALAITAVGLSGVETYKKGWIALRHRNLNINALMSIAVTCALLLGAWAEAAMVMVLFTLAEAIEARSLDRARNAILGLQRLAPDVATVRQSNGQWVDVPAHEVILGQTVRVKPGERIALDGRVINGMSTVNQAPITGESMPVEKQRGDAVYAGTINEAGSFEYEVTAAAGETTLARVIRAIEEAQGARAPTQRFIDRFASVYTPAVVGFAILIAVVPPLFFDAGWYDWIYRALVLLVIACPCALVISTPVTIVSGLAAAARQGILVKGGAYLEQGHRLSWLALDKTGTLTHGKPARTDSIVLEPSATDKVHQIAQSLATRSDHPVSVALVRGFAAQRPKNLLPVEDFAAIGGRGVEGRIDGVVYRLGNHRLLHERGMCAADLETRIRALEQQGKTVVMVDDGERVLSLYAVADTVKETSRDAIESLHKLGVRTVMLTGDNAHVAQTIAKEVGIDDVRGNLLPEDKLRVVDDYARQGPVGMVGDGINDAPALARANIGFAMAAMGTDTAIETADVALMDDDLRKIPKFVRLSRATRGVLMQNIGVALGIKLVFLVLTLVGLGTMWMAVFADVGASLIVVANGLRLLRK